MVLLFLKASLMMMALEQRSKEIKTKPWDWREAQQVQRLCGRIIFGAFKELHRGHGGWSGMKQRGW